MTLKTSRMKQPDTDSKSNQPEKPTHSEDTCLSKTKHHLLFFLESISIRGCNRIVKAQSRFIRYLWIIFILFTSMFLNFSIMRLVNEYLTYSVNIQTYVDMDAPSDFPAVTFCNHQPFSTDAYQLWQSGKIQSPTKFNQLLRQTADRLWNQSMRDASFTYVFAFDSIKMYYQNLDWPYPKYLGHKKNQSISMCLFRYSGENLSVGGPGCEDQMIRITERSHPLHFNCHTVEFERNAAQLVQELGLIIWLGPPESYDIQHRQAFLMDLFDQAHGLRVAIHEPGQMANLESQGIQIEPGRMNELNFDAIRTIHQETPRKPCITSPQKIYTDLESHYEYEFELCLNTHLQQVLMERCSCLYAYLPRIRIPSRDLPYCGRIMDGQNRMLDSQQIKRRLNCAIEVISQSAILKKSFEENGFCLRRCTNVYYESTVSVTTWRSTQWQLYWSQQTSAALESLHKPNSDLKSLENYYRSENLSILPNVEQVSESLTGKYGFSDRYTYVLIKRKNNDTIVKAETLVLTLNALVSRIGGLCSLYIGMTFAVLIELIEFIYVISSRSLQPKEDRRSLNNRAPVAQEIEPNQMENYTDLVPNTSDQIDPNSDTLDADMLLFRRKKSVEDLIRNRKSEPDKNSDPLPDAGLGLSAGHKDQDAMIKQQEMIEQV